MADLYNMFKLLILGHKATEDYNSLVKQYFSALRVVHLHRIFGVIARRT